MVRCQSAIIGDIGETKALYEFSRYGIPVLLPFGNNVSYDLCIDCLGEILKVQVKTISKIKNNRMSFEICQNNGFTGEHWNYSTSDVDLFFLYCIENDTYALVPYKEVTGIRNVTIRLNNSNLYTNSKVARYASDYTIERTLRSLGFEVYLE